MAAQSSVLRMVLGVFALVPQNAWYCSGAIRALEAPIWFDSSARHALRESCLARPSPLRLGWYMVARTLAADPIVRFLDSGNGIGGNALAAEVRKELWPVERRRQRELFCFGMDILLKLDLEGTRRFFDAFFDLEPHHWHGFLSSRLFLRELALLELSLFAHASNTSRLEIMAKEL